MIGIDIAKHHHVARAQDFRGIELVSYAHFLHKQLDCVLFSLIKSVKLNKLDSNMEKTSYLSDKCLFIE